LGLSQSGFFFAYSDLARAGIRESHTQPASLKRRPNLRRSRGTWRDISSPLLPFACLGCALNGPTVGFTPGRLTAVLLFSAYSIWSRGKARLFIGCMMTATKVSCKLRPPCHCIPRGGFFIWERTSSHIANFMRSKSTRFCPSGPRLALQCGQTVGKHPSPVFLKISENPHWASRLGGGKSFPFGRPTHQGLTRETSCACRVAQTGSE